MYFTILYQITLDNTILFYPIPYFTILYWGSPNAREAALFSTSTSAWPRYHHTRYDTADNAPYEPNEPKETFQRRYQPVQAQVFLALFACWPRPPAVCGDPLPFWQTSACTANCPGAVIWGTQDVYKWDLEASGRARTSSCPSNKHGWAPGTLER